MIFGKNYLYNCTEVAQSWILKFKKMKKLKKITLKGVDVNHCDIIPKKELMHFKGGEQYTGIQCIAYSSNGSIRTTAFYSAGVMEDLAFLWADIWNLCGYYVECHSVIIPTDSDYENNTHYQQA